MLLYKRDRNNFLDVKYMERTFEDNRDLLYVYKVYICEKSHIMNIYTHTHSELLENKNTPVFSLQSTVDKGMGFAVRETWNQISPGTESESVTFNNCETLNDLLNASVPQFPSSKIETLTTTFI